MSGLSKLLEGIAPDMPFIMSLMGGLARSLRRQYIGGTLILAGRVLSSAFAGLVVYLFLKDHPEISLSAKAAIAGVAGYAGVDLLDALSARIIRIAEKANAKE